MEIGALDPQPRTARRINLALQGGGAHGAFTWGVLDRLLEEPDLEIVGVSGVSAGAMNAVVMAHGLAAGGREGARAALRAFWAKIAEGASRNAFAPTLFDRATGLAGLGLSPGALWLEGVSRLASPYDLNPSGDNPLAEVLAERVDFDALRRGAPVRLFVGATNVRSGKLRVFGPDEISLEAVLASACLPQLFHAVEIEGEHYWDGGYTSNPPVLPLLERTDCDDVVIVQIDPIRLDEVPTTPSGIRDRVQGLGFNAGLMREMHTIAMLARPLGEGARGGGRKMGSLIAGSRRLSGATRRLWRQRLHVHMIEAEEEMAQLGAASKMDAEEASLEQLFELGRARAGGFLAEHKGDIGVRSSLDVVARFL
jgi:NTE family protein